MKGMYIVIAGPSGAGKDSVIREVLKRRNNLLLNVSYTSREKRDDEIDGFDYHFVSREKFEQMINNNEFVEFVEYGGEYYGTRNLSKEEFENNDVVFRKDVRGAISIKVKFPFVITIYLMPANNLRLKEQKGDRGDNRDDIARQEKNPAKTLDFLVVNDKIEKAADEIISIIDIYKAHSMKNPINIQFMDEFYK